ncbi:acyltransferase [Parabacteroides sp.]
MVIFSFDSHNEIHKEVFISSIYSCCPFNSLRVTLYKLIGYKIGRGNFIGMRCYLDDMCYNLIEIGSNVTISYGVYFACHGRKQRHNKIIIKDGAYVGMRSNIIARQDKGTIIGENAIVVACSLVKKSVPAGATVVGIPAKEININKNDKK